MCHAEPSPSCSFSPLPPPQVPVALPAEPPAQRAQHASVADEVAALNAEMCAALSGLVGEESPDKFSRRRVRLGREGTLVCSSYGLRRKACGCWERTLPCLGSQFAGRPCRATRVAGCMGWQANSYKQRHGALTWPSIVQNLAHARRGAGETSGRCGRSCSSRGTARVRAAWQLAWGAQPACPARALVAAVLFLFKAPADSLLCAAYYERLLAMQEAEAEQQRAEKQQAAGGGRQQRGAVAGGAAAKATARTPAPKAAAAPAQAAGQPAAAAQAAAPAPAAAAKPTPSPLQVALAGSSAVAAAKAALMTPNSQRRKLNELTESLQLLKVSTRHSRAAAAIQAAQQQRGATPAPEGAPAAAGPAPAAASHTPRSRSGSPEPPPAASDRASAEPAAPPKTGGKRGGRRGASPPTEASAAVAGMEQASAAVGNTGGGQSELHAALAEKDALAEQLRAVQAELAAEREARAAAQQELQELQAKRKVGGGSRGRFGRRWQK